MDTTLRTHEYYLYIHSRKNLVLTERVLNSRESLGANYEDGNAISRCRRER